MSIVDLSKFAYVQAIITGNYSEILVWTCFWNISLF